ncbi:MAG: hypothetical protein GY739_07370 [Mesoflavibacter sp.]|nr:hypothetical protein [Mesoflavibacter sp.]
MSNYKLQEHLDFYQNVKIECLYNSKSSAYYKATYKDEVYKFCVSDHHGMYRGNLITIISKKRNKNKIKQIAWDIRQKL